MYNYILENNIFRKIIITINNKEKYIVFSLLFSVIILGIIYSFFLMNSLRYPDEYDNYNIAQSIIYNNIYSLDGVHPTTFRPPGYPVFISLFISFGADIIHLRIINFLIFSLSIYLILNILKNICSVFSGLLGAVLVMCYPVLFYTAGTLYPQTFGSFLFLLIIYVLIKAHVNGIKYYIFAGILCGFLILTIPMFVLSVLIFSIFILFTKCEKKITSSAILLFTTLLTISPWSIRNYYIYKSFVLVSTNAGVNLLLGNSENTTPNVGVNVDISKYIIKNNEMNEVQKDRYYKSRAIEFIFNNKQKSIKLYILKFLNYFNFKNTLYVKTEQHWIKNIIMLLTYGPLLILFIIRMLLYKQFPFSGYEILFIILYFANAFFYAIFFTRIRFRLPFDYLLIAIAAMFIHNLIREF